MILASINMNKRLGNVTTRAKLTQWLLRHRVDVVAVQEPVKPPTSPAVIELDGYKFVGGDDRAAFWADERLELPSAVTSEGFIARLQIGYFCCLNVYADAYEQTARARQFSTLREIALAGGDQPFIAVGDFNIAPTADDGLNNGIPSTFNSLIDREPLSTLIRDAKFHDLGTSVPREFTVERTIGSAAVKFRCDLALVTDYVAADVTLRYDHSVRRGETSFTDHSGLLISMPVDLPKVQMRTGLLFPIHAETDNGADESTADEDYSPHKTAMSRRDPSPIAVQVTEQMLSNAGYRSILDYGCGRGADVAHYLRNGFDAVGYDPYEPFGWAELPRSVFDVVTCVFVLNVVPNPWERLRVLERCAACLKPGGLMVVAARSPEEIDRQALQNNWRRHNDGYWSHAGRRTFQKGISKAEMLRLAGRLGLKNAQAEEKLRLGPSTSVAAFTI